MGFWQTGYAEFHEPTEERRLTAYSPPPPRFPCPSCGIVFSAERDLQVHGFEGHATSRPIMVFRNRECGRSRLTITPPVTEVDWLNDNLETVEVKGRPCSVDGAINRLSRQRSGMAAV